MNERPEVTEEPAEPEGIEAELLVEEVSIDGMCGVY
jgi:mycofactocin precursor